MTVARDGTFVWVTWLSKLMAGEISCEWAPWFRSHYQDYAKAPSTFDQATWNIKHTRLLRLATRWRDSDRGMEASWSRDLPSSS